MADGHTLQATATPEPAVSFVDVRWVTRPHTNQEDLSQVHRLQQLGSNGVRIPSFSLVNNSFMCYLAQEPPSCKDLTPGTRLFRTILSPG